MKNRIKHITEKYEPMKFLDEINDGERKYLHFLHDKIEHLDKFMFHFIHELGNYMCISDDSLIEIYQAAKRKYENGT